MERREYVRLPKTYRVSLKKLAFPLSRQKELSLECVDISCGGMRIQSPVRLETGQLLQLEVGIPRLNKFHPGYFKVFESDLSQSLQAVAEVAWVREVVSGVRFEAGIRFVNVDGDDWKALYRLIADNM
ncbi:MAG: PilZ domain-containing protein [Desulfonatronovibrionaceae bacterium]